MRDREPCDKGYFFLEGLLNHQLIYSLMYTCRYAVQVLAQKEDHRHFDVSNGCQSLLSSHL